MIMLVEFYRGDEGRVCGWIASPPPPRVAGASAVLACPRGVECIALFDSLALAAGGPPLRANCLDLIMNAESVQGAHDRRARGGRCGEVCLWPGVGRRRFAALLHGSFVTGWRI